MKKLNYLVIVVLVVMHILLFYYFIQNSPLLGDGAFHQNIIENYHSSGEINGQIENLKGSYGFPRYVEEYPVAYPPLYHTYGTLLYDVFQNKTVYVMDLIFTTILILFSFLFTVRFFNYKISILFTSLIALVSSLIYSGGNNNIILLYSGLVSFYFLIMFFDSKDTRYFILFCLYFVFSLGTKQLIYFFNFALIIGLIVFLVKKINIKEIRRYFLIFSIFLLFFIPILMFQINTTGTISTPAIRGWPIIDNILSPNYLDIPDWQKEIDYKVDIEKLNYLSASKYYEVNKKFFSIIFSPFDFFNQYFNIYKVYFLPASLNFDLPLNFLSFIFFVGIIYFFRKLNFSNFTLGLIILFGFLVVVFTSKVEYYLFLPYLGGFFLCYGLFKLSNSNKYLLLFFIFFIILLTILSSIYTVSEVIDFQKTTYMRTKISGGYDTFLNLTNWLNENSNDSDLIMVANTQDLPYYSDGNYFWDYRLFFLNRSDLLHYLDNYKNLKYVIILNNQIKQEFTNWVDIPSSSEFLDILNDDNYFHIVYDYNEIKIYKINKNESTN